MKLGVSTASLYPLETELALREIGEAGVKLTEIFFNAECELKPEFVKILLAIQKEYGIEIPSVHPTLSLAEPFMLFSNYERRFKEGLDTYRRYSEVAAALGAKYIIMHGGKENGLTNEEEYCERYMRLQAAVRENGVTVLQENVSLFRAGDLGFLAAMKRILGDDAQFCADIKQAVRRGLTIYEIIEVLGNNIKHFHISDHSAGNDCLLPGRGGFDFSRFFGQTSAIGYDGAYVIEVYSSAYRRYHEIFDSFHSLSGGS